jgi:hypothetical protein
MIAGADLRLLRAGVFTAVCVTLSAAGHALAGGQRIPLWSLGVSCALVFAVAAPLAGRERSLPGIVVLLSAGQIALHTLYALAQRPAPMNGTPGMPGMDRLGGGAGMAAARGGLPAHASGSGAGGQGPELRGLASRLLCGQPAPGSLSEAKARRIVSDAGLGSGRPGPLGGHGGLGGHGAHPGAHMAAAHDATAGASAAAPFDSALSCLREATHAALSLLNCPMLLCHLAAALGVGLLLRRGEAALWRLVRLSARGARSAMGPVGALRVALAWVRALYAGLLPDAAWVRCCAEGPRRERAPRPLLLDHSVHRRGPPGDFAARDFAARRHLMLAA